MSSAATSATRGCASSSSPDSSTARTSVSSRCSSPSGSGKIVAQAVAIVLVTPLELPREQALVVPALRRARVALAPRPSLAPVAHAAQPPPDRHRSPPHAAGGHATAKARLTGAEAERIFLAFPKVARLARALPDANPATDATLREGHLDRERLLRARRARSRRARVDDATGAVLEAWTGPQVAWKMARGGAGRVRRQEDQLLPGLARVLRRSSCSASSTGGGRSRCATVDLLVMLSFSVSLWFFNRGNIFAAMPLVYPGLVWLLAALLLGRQARPRRRAARPSGRSGC